MATEDSSSSTFPLFVDTNIETHLLILVSSNDTVADLKGRIRTEHLRSFPDVGEVSVGAMKLKRRGSFYSLSDSMVVNRAFDGIKGARFLHIDLVPAASLAKSQTGVAKVIMRENDAQPDNHNLLQAGHGANTLVIEGEDRHGDPINNRLSTEKGLTRTSVSSAHESETLPDAHVQKLLGQGLDTRQDHDVSEMEELLIEGNVAAGSHVQQKVKEVANRKDKDERSENHENVGVGANMDVPAARNEEKSRKRHNVLETDQVAGDKSEHPYVEKKRHKKERDKSSKEFLKETARPENSFQEKHDNVLVSLEGFHGKPSHVDSSLQAHVDAKQKRKKKKHTSNIDETPQNQMVDSSLNNPDDTTPGKQASEENHVEELIKSHRKESEAANLLESIQDVLDDGKSEDPSVENKMSEKEKNGKLSDNVSSLQPPVDTKQKRKRKKHFSKHNESLHTELVDNSSNKIQQGKQAAEVNHAEELVNNPMDLRKESNAADPMEEMSQKNLETVLPENGFREKCGTNLMSPDGIPSKLSDAHSLQDPVDAKQKRKKQKHSSKGDEALKNDIIRNLGKANDASQGKHPSEENHAEELVKNHAELEKESDKTDLIKVNTLKLHDGRSEELCMTDSLLAKLKESTDTKKPNTDFPVQDENFKEACGNNHAQLSKVSDMVLSNVDLANKNAMESGIPSEINAKSSHRKRKKRENAELSNARSNAVETVNSPRDQVPEEIQNKTSITCQEQLLGSTALSCPDERKKKRSKKKSEKIKVHQESNLPTGTQEADNSSMDQIMGELSKEISIKHLEAASLKEAVEISPSVQSIVSSNPIEEKSKRSRIKSDKIKLPCGDFIRAESAHSLLDEATKENPQESVIQSKTLGRDLGHPNKDSEVATADKKSKRSRKKSGKCDLSNKEYCKDEAVSPLQKEDVKENPGGTLNDISASMDKNSKSATTLREAACLERVTELNPVITSADGMNSSRNYDLDHSLANEHANENLEKISGITNKSTSTELNARRNPDETSHGLDHVNISNLVPTGFGDSSGNNKAGCLSAEKDNTIRQEKASEGSMETVADTVDNTPAEAEDLRRLPKSDSANINFIKFFDPNLNQPEEVQGLPSGETETNKTSKEKTKRKKKLNRSPQDSTPPVSSEQQVSKKKPQDSDSGKPSLIATAVNNAKEELKSRKNHEKGDACGIQKHNTSSDLGSPVDDRIEKKLKHHGSNMHIQGSPTEDKKKKHPTGKTSTGSELQSLARGGDVDVMVSASKVSKYNIDDASVRSTTGGAAKHSSSAVANTSLEEDVAGLAASSDSTEDDTPIQKKRYRVAVRKVPSKRYEDVSNKSVEEKTVLAASASIFSDATSGSSGDEFEINTRRPPVRTTSDNSSTSDDVDGYSERTQTTYKNSPDGSESTECHKVGKGTDTLMSPTKSSKARRGKTLSSILRSSSSYKKAKLTASQSANEDSESQFDIVPETQPE